jgi:hypothetical protein
MDPDQTARMRRLVWIHAGRKPIMLVLECHGSFLLEGPFQKINVDGDKRLIWMKIQCYGCMARKDRETQQRMHPRRTTLIWV